jgi:hypothetical protein
MGGQHRSKPGNKGACPLVFSVPRCRFGIAPNDAEMFADYAVGRTISITPGYARGRAYTSYINSVAS